jgi:hypothetical protein
MRIPPEAKIYLERTPAKRARFNIIVLLRRTKMAVAAAQNYRVSRAAQQFVP